MAESKSKTQDGGAAEVEKAVTSDQEQGFSGTKVDPIANEEYSLESGPDSPTVQEQRDALARKRAEEAS